MKFGILLLLVCLAGCAKSDRFLDDQRDSKVAAQEQVYTSAHGMIRQQVVALLGQPMKKIEDGDYWELRFSPKCYASLAVKFDVNGIAYQTKNSTSFENSRPRK